MNWARRLFELLSPGGTAMGNESWMRKLYDHFATNGVPASASELSALSVAVAANTAAIAALQANFGTYTATTSSLSNLSSLSVPLAQWFRVGDMVSVFGSFTADPTLTGFVSFQVTLPVSTSSATSTTLTGVAATSAVTEQATIAGSGLGTNKATVSWTAVDILSRTWTYNFQYQVT